MNQYALVFGGLGLMAALVVTVSVIASRRARARTADVTCPHDRCPWRFTSPTALAHHLADDHART